MKACTRATANVIADFLEKEVFYKFDVPEILVTDNGTQFTSEFFEKFVKEHKIRHIKTPVYHPQSNTVEATNKCVKTMLRAELLKRLDHTDWSAQLQRVVMNLNTNPRMPTGQSPHYLVYGRERHRTGNEHGIITDVNEPLTMEEKQEQMGLIYEQAAEEQRAAYEQNKRRYNLRTTVRTFKAGDAVYIKNHKQSAAGEKYAQKLAPLRKAAVIKCKQAGATDIYEVIDNQGHPLGCCHSNDIYTK